MRLVIRNFLSRDFAHPMTVSREAEERFRDEAYRKHGIVRDSSAILEPILVQARKLDFMRFLPGVSKINLVPDNDKWNAAFDFDADTIELQAKLFRKSPQEQLQIFMHEVGHRGQMVKPAVYKEFIDEGHGSVENFLAMANDVHQEDYKINGIENPGEEAWAESYSRYVLNRPMPKLTKYFWQEA